MNLQQSVRTCLRKYVTFSGRAQRSEYWWFILFVVTVNFALTLLDSALFGSVETYGSGFSATTDTPVFSGIFNLLVLLPTVSAVVRRLHDVNRSVWWYLIVLIPLIGAIMMLVWLASKGTVGQNRFGPDPMKPSYDDDGDTQDYSPSRIPHVTND